MRRHTVQSEDSVHRRRRSVRTGCDASRSPTPCQCREPARPFRVPEVAEIRSVFSTGPGAWRSDAAP